MILLHKTINLTTNYYGKEGASGSNPAGSLVVNACPVRDKRFSLLPVTVNQNFKGLLEAS